VSDPSKPLPASLHLPEGPSLVRLVGQLRDTTARFAAIEDIDSLVVLIDDLIGQTVGVPYYGLYLVDPRTGSFRLPIAKGFSAEEMAEAERTAMERHPGWVFRNRQILHVPDVLTDQENRTRSSKRDFTVRSRLWIPVMSRDECVGAFGMADPKPHAFTEEHIAVLQFVSNLAGIVYRNLTSTAALREALERVEAADRAKTAFLANMSHELRTPMNGVLGAASLLATTSLDLEQRELVGTVQASSRTMVALVDDLLEFSKLESGQLEIRATAMDLDVWLDSAIEIVAPTVAERRLALSVRFEPDAPRGLFADPLRARQVLLNLLSNAIKFTEYGTVRVGVGRTGEGAVRIEVEDSGIGIAPGHLDRLFTRFSQVESSISRRFGGTGLGLAISRQLAEGMGGTLTLGWTKVGYGSCFVLTLPSAEVPQPAPPGLRDVEVCVSDPSFADDVRSALVRLGCRVREGVDTAPEQPVLLTDGPVPVGRVGFRVGQATDATLRPPLRIGAVRRLLTPERAVAEVPSAKPSTDALRVLVVDDNAVNRTVARRLLERMGHQVDDVDDGLSAVAAVREGRHDVILLDVHMPGEDGLSVARRLRRGDGGPVGRVIPIVACTADLLPETEQLCHEAGMHGVVFKPIVPDVLARAVHEAWAVARRILVVDDAPSNRKVLRWMLERRGLTVDEASDGAEAVACLSARGYRFIVLDEHLGDRSGRDVVESLRAMSVPWRTLPVIACSGSSVGPGGLGAYDDRLPKPVETSFLDAILRRWGPRGTAGAA
jgi:signal transduction histidine kinase/DNA-binding response OmpR family regulator